MNADCFDIGIIQAFLDGELAHGEMSRVSTHVAQCDTCAIMLAEAEDESAIVFPALEREFNTLVPTQRLWNKINDSIKIERDNLPFWHKAWAFLTLAVVNPSLVAAASILIVATIVATFWLNRTPIADSVAVSVNPTKSAVIPIVATPSVVDTTDEIKSQTPVKLEQTAFRADNRRIIATPAVYKTSSPATANSEGYMPGEESYVKTISSLTKTVEGQKDGIMHPSERIAYERDMAVVNDAIGKMRTEVKRNPKNESAKQVLYSSYQNKIDLLNSVSQKEELMASLK